MKEESDSTTHGTPSPSEIKLSFSVSTQLTIPQLCKQRGVLLKSLPGKFTVTGSDAEWTFEEDELRTCQEVIENTLAKQFGEGKVSSMASRGISVGVALRVAKELGFASLNQDEDVKKAVSHIMAMRRQVQTVEDVDFAKVVAKALPDFWRFPNPSEPEFAYLKSAFPLGKKNLEGDFIFGTSKFPSYESERMKQCISWILKQSLLAEQEDIIESTAQEFTGDLQFLHSLKNYKDMNTLRNKAMSDPKAKELNEKLSQLTTGITMSQLRTIPKMFPVGTLDEKEFVSQSVTNLRQKFPRETENLVQALIFLRGAQITVANGKITKPQ